MGGKTGRDDVLPALARSDDSTAFRAGFVLDRLVETEPTERFREKDSETDERISREPTFLALRARTMD